MKDQAQNLRELVARKKREGGGQGLRPGSRTRVIAITGGKGGVGKSCLACNLAVALGKNGHRTLLFDGDLGMANADLLLGISPEYTLEDVLKGAKELSEILTTAPGKIRVIAGGSGVFELANMEERELDRFIKGFSDLEGEADFIVIDTAAGLSRHNIGLLLAADEVIVVTTPEPTSLTDAYGVVKVLCGRGFHARINFIVNRVESGPQAREVAGSFSRACADFLQIRLEYLGYILEHRLVSQAVFRQRPFVISCPRSQPAESVTDIARMLSGEESGDRGGRGIKAFFYRLAGFLN